MKIVYFNYLYDRLGISLGSTRKAEQLMQALSDAGHDVRLFWMKRGAGSNQRIPFEKKNAIKSLLSKYLHDPKQLFSNIIYLVLEWRILNQVKPDLVISRLELHLFSSLLLCKLKKIPLIIEADAPCRYEIKTFCPEFKQMIRFAKWIENMNLNYANHSICVSNEMRSYFIQEGVDPEKISVVTNGANIQHFHPFVRNDEVVHQYEFKGKIVIGFIGSFHLWHGIENLMKVMRYILTRYHKVVFLLIGQGGPMKQELEALIRQDGLESRVILTGYVDYDRMPGYIVSMDIVLALYPNLSFFYYSPMKIYEYMACGRAVLATRIGQIREIIQDGENGLLCDPDQFEELIHALERLIERPDLRQQLGKRAWESIRQDHSWKQKGEVWSQVCETVVHRFKSENKDGEVVDPFHVRKMG